MALLSFHNDVAIKEKYLTPDALCVEVLRKGFITVDAQRGEAFSQRFAGKKLGTANSEGYQVCTLHLDGQRKQIKLHRLIWISVFGIPLQGFMPDHINRKKSDNRIANLRLVNSKENARNRRSYRGNENPAAKITIIIAGAIRERHEETHSYSQVSKEFQVSRSLVAQIVRRELWT